MMLAALYSAAMANSGDLNTVEEVLAPGITQTQLPRLPGNGSVMVGDSRKEQNSNNLLELEASLVPAEAEVGADHKRM